jgi:hypothetical protein
MGHPRSRLGDSFPKFPFQLFSTLNPSWVTGTLALAFAYSHISPEEGEIWGTLVRGEEIVSGSLFSVLLRKNALFVTN